MKHYACWLPMLGVRRLYRKAMRAGAVFGTRRSSVSGVTAE
jgi:hypothetical protein